jgi:hypothetical protein
MTVNPNGISPVLCHPRLPNHRIFGTIVPVVWVAIPVIKLFRCLFGPGLKNRLGTKKTACFTFRSLECGRSLDQPV